MAMLSPRCNNFCLYFGSFTTILAIIALYFSVDLSQFSTELESWMPSPLTINISQEKIEGLQRAKRNLHRKFWDKRNSVSKFCSTNPPEIVKQVHSDISRWKRDLWVDVDHGIIWCCNPKVGSSTMIHHFLDLVGLSTVSFNKEMFKRRIRPAQWRAEANKMFNLPDNSSISETSMLFVSVAFVRHPFSRLTSGYLEKLVFAQKINGKLAPYNFMNELIIQTCRTNASDSSPIATEKEFTQFLLKNARENQMHSFDLHFRPQSLTCPFCSLEFDMIADIDSFNTSLLFLADQLNIKDKINLKIVDNNRKKFETDESRIQRFLSRISKSMIIDLYNEIYKVDFDMFGFPYPEEYIQMGLP